MLMRLDNPWLVDDLCAHYARSGFLVLRVVGSMIEVRRPNARDEHEERRMIEMHRRRSRLAGARKTERITRLPRVVGSRSLLIFAEPLNPWGR
jgi:hypothetical protein